jgi:hypothetical protein
MNLLQWMGARSICCNAKFVFDKGWDYRTDGYVCSVCGTTKDFDINPRKRKENKQKTEARKAALKSERNVKLEKKK